MDSTATDRAPGPRAAAKTWAGLPPAAGSAVMATGIVSVGLHVAGHEILSLILLALAAGLWVLLAADFTRRFFYDRHGFAADAATPPALTAVAATAVLGTRLSLAGHHTIAEVLLAVAAAAWPGLLVSVMRHWKRGMPGAAFLVCVATQGLAVLAGTLELAGRGGWLGDAALALFALGLVLYGEALVRFDMQEIVTGLGDQWIAAGALAISALAGSKLVASDRWTDGGHQALRVTTLVLLGLDMAGYAVLLAAEIVRPRPRYTIKRWATVFPLGMTAVAALSTASAEHLPWLRSTGEALLWVAFAAWLLTGVAAVATAAKAASSRRPQHP